MKISLANKRALVCGASQGIGEAIAHKLSTAGAEVILIARSKDKLESILTQLPRENNQNHQCFALDLTNECAIEETIDLVLKKGPISIIINNSGGPKSGPLLQAESNDFLHAFQSHILAASILSKRCFPGMKDQKFGRLINIISTSVKAPIPNLGVSNTIRGAMANWSKSLSIELAPFGITVNNVLPGYTQTPRLDSLALAAAQKQNKTVEEIKTLWKALTPAGRFAAPEEIADAVTFLASSQAAFITGINLPIDGGRTPCL